MTAPFFAHNSAALRAHEQRLANKPRSWPPTNHPVPTLWERAQALFAVMLATIGSIAELAARHALRRKERRELLIRLKPVEAIVRTLLLIEAVTYLLMTPSGQKLLRTAKPCRIPEPPAPPPPPQSPARTAFTPAMQAALQTIACLRPRIDPRIAAREERERREALAAALAAQAETPARTRFSVLRWTSDKVIPEAPERTSGPWVDVLDEAYPWRDDTPDGASAADGESAPCAALARRIEALARILADPMPAIRRLAARLAGLPPEVIARPYARAREASLWHHGRPEYFNAIALAQGAHRAFLRAHPRLLDPG